MNHRIVQVVIVVCLVAVGWVLGQSAIRPSFAQGGVKIPKSAGSVKGAFMSFLVLEDTDGVIRLVDPRDGEIQLTIRRN